MKNISFIRRGSGFPLLLVHGLGGSAESWCTVLNLLAEEREIIAIDLPGFGESSPLEGPITIEKLADAVSQFLADKGLLGIDAVGVSAGASVVLELARRQDTVGSAVAITPSGFCRGVERHAFFASLFTSMQLVRKFQPVLPEIAKSKLGRTAMLAMLSSHPARITSQTALTEMRSYLKSKSFDELLKELSYGARPAHLPFGSIGPALTIGWGKRDRLSLPREAYRVLETYPDAKLRWFNDSGHSPHWDSPEETVQLILENTGIAKRLVNGLARTAARVRSAQIDLPAL